MKFTCLSKNVQELWNALGINLFLIQTQSVKILRLCHCFNVIINVASQNVMKSSDILTIKNVGTKKDAWIPPVTSIWIYVK